jgi:hypothetical protein
LGYYGYRKRTYRNWRGRTSWNQRSSSKYSELRQLFGDAVGEIRTAFLRLDPEALDELLSDYGVAHGASAEQYARKTLPSWQSGSVGLSGQTMERLVELVPPYLEGTQRIEIVKKVLLRHKPQTPTVRVRIDATAPAKGFADLEAALTSLNSQDVLAYMPEYVMKAAAWLYDDDVTAARAMLAEVKNAENKLTKATAEKELGLLRRAIMSKQIKSASYTAQLPAGAVSVVVFEPSIFSRLSRLLGG